MMVNRQRGAFSQVGVCAEAPQTVRVILQVRSSAPSFICQLLLEAMDGGGCVRGKYECH